MMLTPHLIDADQLRIALAGVHALLCLGIAGAVVCRLNVTHRGTRPDVRAQFAALFGGAVASGLQPVLWSEWPGWGSVTLAAMLLVYLVLGWQRWRHGAPPGTASDWMGLSAPEHPAEPAP
jgi:hypothetical protein